LWHKARGHFLSPILFCIYDDNILAKIDKMGCRFKGAVIGSIMYADDLILLSSSIQELQKND